MKLLTVLASFVLLLGCSAPSEPQSDSKDDQEAPSSLTKFAPSSGELSQLGDPVQIADYKISPPKEFNKQEPASPNGTKLVGWIGTTRSDGSSPMIQLMIVTPPAGEQLPNLEQATSKMIAGVRRRRSNWTESDISYGLIGGIKFAKKTWAGKEQNSGISMVGTMYVGIDGNSLIQLHTQDVESQADSLKLGETSLLSFTK